jgi:leucyl/phenylalanyl-tRNA--protein transferase
MILSLTSGGILEAYEHGIFPMADELTGEIDWYLPDPRAIIPLDRFHASRSLRKQLRKREFDIRIDCDFTSVMRGCADREEGSWISEEFVKVYGELYQRGFAHSVEAWKDGRLVGGLYGVSIGGAFMAESMFHRETGASKAALFALVELLARRNYLLLDVQFATPHLRSLGAVEIPLPLYSCLLRSAVSRDCSLTS